MNPPAQTSLLPVTLLGQLSPEQIQGLHRQGIFFVGNLIHLGEQLPDRMAELLSLSDSELSTVIASKDLSIFSR